MTNRGNYGNSNYPGRTGRPEGEPGFSNQSFANKPLGNRRLVSPHTGDTSFSGIQPPLTTDNHEKIPNSLNQQSGSQILNREGINADPRQSALPTSKPKMLSSAEGESDKPKANYEDLPPEFWGSMPKEVQTRAQKCIDKLPTFINGMVQDRDKTNDIMQEVLIRVHDQTKIDGERITPAWINKVAFHLFIEEFRGLKLRNNNVLPFSRASTIEGDGESLSIINTIPDESPLPEDILEKKEEHDELMRAIVDLPIKYRRAVLLHGVWDLEYDEIARILGIPKQTIHTQYNRGVKKLRGNLSIDFD